MFTNRVDSCGKPIGEVDAGSHPASVLSDWLYASFPLRSSKTPEEVVGRIMAKQRIKEIHIKLNGV